MPGEHYPDHEPQETPDQQPGEPGGEDLMVVSTDFSDTESLPMDDRIKRLIDEQVAEITAESSDPDVVRILTRWTEIKIRRNVAHLRAHQRMLDDRAKAD